MAHLCLVVLRAELQQTPGDHFALFPDIATVEEVLRAVAKQEGYTEERWRRHAQLLAEKEIDTVHNLRALNREDIKELGLPPVVTRYLLRVKAGGEQ
jgi:hypothetical protein